MNRISVLCCSYVTHWLKSSTRYDVGGRMFHVGHDKESGDRLDRLLSYFANIMNSRIGMIKSSECLSFDTLHSNRWINFIRE